MEEVSLFFVGVIFGIQVIDELVFVIDCGGGLMELVLGCGFSIDFWVSFNIGLVWLCECFFYDDLFIVEQIDDVCKYVCEVLDFCLVDVVVVCIVIGVVGMVMSLFVIGQNFIDYDCVKVYCLVLMVGQIFDLVGKLFLFIVDEVEQMGLLK